ncbi:MAG: N-acetylmuramoyl-L-alanine amidase [Puniceicoccaceae bacterium]
MADINRRKFLFSLAGIALGAPLLTAAGNPIYRVRKGDTLSAIARQYGVTVGELRAANDIRGSLIHIDQTLIIPQPSSALASVLSETKRIRVNHKKWKYIVAHHSATPQGNATIFDQVNRRRGMKNGLAYHFVIGNGKGSPDGAIEVGSRWTHQMHGGHVSKWEYNNHGIGICLVGNFEKSRPTRKQMESFDQLVEYLGGSLLDNRFKFLVHKEINPTLCPGRFFPTQQKHRQFG